MARRSISSRGRTEAKASIATGKKVLKQEVVEINGHCIEPKAARDALVRWGRKHFRPFPWRNTKDSYAVLMAELMLHRTQVAQVTPVYTRFMARFPDLESLAAAPKRRVANLLRKLGLQWRIDLIPATARALMADFNGTVPRDKVALCGLGGVSDYIASAVRCFAFDEPEPLIDTNTVRIVGRLFGLPMKDSSRRNPIFKQAMSELLDRKRPRAYNYALLDHAHTVCRKRDPDCEVCPLLRWCVFGHGTMVARGKAVQKNSFLKCRPTRRIFETADLKTENE